jgi:hypothetical protein
MTIKKELTGWLDIDAPHLPELDPAERIDYLELRIRKVLLRPLEQLVESSDFLGNSDSSAISIVAASICHGIEAMGRFMLNGSSDPEGEGCFVAFSGDYMNEDLRLKRINGVSYARLLWRYFRCGLSHGFCIRHGSFDGGRDDPYLTCKKSHLNVNPYRFYSDFRHGVELYPSDLRKAKPTDELRQDFDKTFDKIFVQRG